MAEASTVPRIEDYMSYASSESEAAWERQNEYPLSIVTVVYEDAEGMRRTMESVARQTMKQDLEYIVVDGGSSDGTLDVIRRREDALDQWISEPDQGISDAFNKGIAMARGEWINLLNAGDAIAGEERAERIAGQLRRTASRIVTTFATSGHTRLPNQKLQNDMSLAHRARISHQGSFVHRSVYASYGGYRTDLKYRMDLDFWLRVLRDETFEFSDVVYCDYEGGGVSAVNHIPMILEGHHVEADHLSIPERIPALFRSLASNAIRVPYYWLRRKWD